MKTYKQFYMVFIMVFAIILNSNLTYADSLFDSILKANGIENDNKEDPDIIKSDLEKEQALENSCKKYYALAKGEYLTLYNAQKEYSSDLKKKIFWSVVGTVAALALHNNTKSDSFGHFASYPLGIFSGIYGVKSGIELATSSKYTDKILRDMVEQDKIKLTDSKGRLLDIEDIKVPKICKENNTWDMDTFSDPDEGVSCFFKPSTTYVQNPRNPRAAEKIEYDRYFCDKKRFEDENEWLSLYGLEDEDCVKCN